MSVGSDDIPDELEQLLSSATENLVSITPEEAIENYLEYKESDIRPQTISEYGRKLVHFREFCDKNGIDDLNELNGRNLNSYRKYRRTETSPGDEPLAPKTMRDEMYLIQNFLRYLGNIEGVRQELSEKVQVPDLSKEDGVRDLEIDPGRVEEILTNLEQFEYATREHVVWLFFTHTGRRPGCLYAIDLGDVHLDGDNPYIEIRHRPPETGLKNKKEGESEVYLDDDVAQVFQHYIKQHRIDVKTETGRQPFLTSKYGRLSKTTMRKYIYRYSRPCVITGSCPHNRDIDSCEAAQSHGSESKCPSSRPIYALRHEYITSKLKEGVPIEIVGGRCDVSPDVIKKHYDERDESERRSLRREIFNEVRDDRDGGGFR